MEDEELPPKPSQMEITGFRIRGVEINWNNTIEVTFTSLYANECLELFRRAPRIIACTIINVVIGHDEGLPELTWLVPTLSSLKTLSISFSSGISGSLVMDPICAPALTHLSVSGKGSYIEQLIDRSPCQLSSLDVGEKGHKFPDRVGISSIARKTPRLQSLLVYGLSSDDFQIIFERLAQPLVYSESDLSPSRFLPQLSTLICSAYPESPLPWSLIPSIFPPADADDDTRCRPFKVLDINFAMEKPDYGHQ